MSGLPQETIRSKRQGDVLTAADISDFVDGIASGAVTDAQISAFAMAVFFNGMTVDECVALTGAMRDSGDVLTWPDAKGPVLDKHSTGGVGDNVSLMLAPIVAACGGVVPMISGRGLGHTGGTLDKLDAIPGYQSQPDISRFRDVVAEVGCAIIGQTGDLAPADRRFYAVRDTTATVESVPLITASILSKKLAAGLHGLVLDVKSGTGAFMESRQGARELAHSLVSVANGAGLKTTALLTDMNEPLASAAGNSVEVLNAIRFLTGDHRDERLHNVVLDLSAELLVMGDLADDLERGQALARSALDDGRAAQRFQEMVAALGGPADLLENPDSHLPMAPLVADVFPIQSGAVNEIDTRSIGLAVVALGGGRTRPQDAINHSVGFTDLAGLGTQVGPNRPLAVVHASDEGSASAASEALQSAYQIGISAVLERIG